VTVAATGVGQVDNLQRVGNPLVEAGGGLHCAVDIRAQDFILPHITAHMSLYSANISTVARFRAACVSKLFRQ
jgi:hypothetical protein